MEKILVVDDNQQNLYMLQVLLTANGFKVEMASNGAEALEMAHQTPPVLIVSDILMPVMDGFALCRAWKKDRRLKKIPFVFYSATYTDPKDEDFALSLGAEHFLVKPMEPDKFLALLKETLEKQEKGRLVAARRPVGQAEYYKEYNAALIRKLEDKVMQLEDKNHVLELDIASRKQAEEKIQQQLAELRRWYDVTIDKETRFIDLKREVNELLRRLNESPRYPSAEE
jgi:CheY-like chemotaxis protein